MNTSDGVGIYITSVLFIMIMAGLFLMLLWNLALVPAISFIQPIGWFQGIGLYILSNILFKNTGSATNIVKTK